MPGSRVRGGEVVGWFIPARAGNARFTPSQFVAWLGSGGSPRAPPPRRPRGSRSSFWRGTRAGRRSTLRGPWRAARAVESSGSLACISRLRALSAAGSLLRYLRTTARCRSALSASDKTGSEDFGRPRLGVSGGRVVPVMSGAPRCESPGSVTRRGSLGSVAAMSGAVPAMLASYCAGLFLARLRCVRACSASKTASGFSSISSARRSRALVFLAIRRRSARSSSDRAGSARGRPRLRLGGRVRPCGRLSGRYPWPSAA